MLTELSKWAYAHRGLHEVGVPENSLGACKAAMEAGLGIEVDVRKSSDGRAIVFHDAKLERLTERSGAMGARTVGDLTEIKLTGSEEMIPTLRDVLELVAGKVPLLLEIKFDDDRPIDALCRAVRRDLEGYHGPVGVMSFDPRVAAWFGSHLPECPRGLVVTEEGSHTLIENFKRRRMVAGADAQFFALDIRDLPSSLSRKQVAAGKPLFTWTVRNMAQVETAREAGAMPILEDAGVAAWGTLA